MVFVSLNRLFIQGVIDMKVEAQLWKMINGNVTELRYDGMIYTVNGVRSTAGRKPIIIKHVEGLPVGSVFDLKKFFKDHQLKTSMQKATYREITRMINSKKLEQHPDDHLKVIR